MVRFPYLNQQLNRLLARWAYKAATSGGFELPGFALADDGFLVAHNGVLYSGSDWIPDGKAIVALGSKRGLCVRYPIRMVEDLLPVEHMGIEEIIDQLIVLLEKQGYTNGQDQLCEQIAATQLQLEGVYVLHAQTAKNGSQLPMASWLRENKRRNRCAKGRVQARKIFKACGSSWLRYAISAIAIRWSRSRRA